MIKIQRLNHHPIITKEMLKGDTGSNINGPSAIEAPDWLPKRLGKFYLYFAHHRGQSIRLAYSDDLAGPWHIYEPGTLQLADAIGCEDHIASPDVHVDHENKQIRMYFHGVVLGTKRQETFLAISDDGIKFTAEAKPMADFYFRAVPWKSSWIGMSKGGVLYYSKHGYADFKNIGKSVFTMNHPKANAPGDVRHVAIKIEEDTLVVYFTKLGDAPEQIYRSEVDLIGDPSQWVAKKITPILSPEMPWEGAELPISPSSVGAANQPENALRDPAIFTYADEDFLFYSVAGESGIGMVKISKIVMDSTDQLQANKNDHQLQYVKRFDNSNLPASEAISREIAFLASEGELKKRISSIDKINPKKRIYIMGCGRSGTWLLTSIMSTMQDVHLVPKEVPVEYFGIFTTSSPTFILKRNYNAYQYIERIPEEVGILYIIRHPYDVLTSFNPTTGRQYHISPHRWLGEMLALQYLIDTGRTNVKIVRYEDLVTTPDLIQGEIAAAFDLQIGSSPDAIGQTFAAPPEAVSAMHGIRRIDTSSLNKFRQDEEKINYLKRIKPRLGRVLNEISNQFDYDLTL